MRDPQLWMCPAHERVLSPPIAGVLVALVGARALGIGERAPSRILGAASCCPWSRQEVRHKSSGQLRHGACVSPGWWRASFSLLLGWRFLRPRMWHVTATAVCQQDLDGPAADRVQRFEQFVTGDLRAHATRLENEIDGILTALPDMANLRAAIEPELRGLPDPVVAAAEHALSVLDARALAARQPGAATGEPPPATVELEPLDMHALAQDGAAEQQAGLRDEQRQQAVLREREELHARAAVTAEF
jgi:hypothetical protein